MTTRQSAIVFAVFIAIVLWGLFVVSMDRPHTVAVDAGVCEDPVMPEHVADTSDTDAAANPFLPQ